MSNTFADLGVPRDLVAVLEAQGITEPFPIQSAAIPDALAGRDLCGQAPTGSGKTIAFALALVARLADEPARPRTPEALVLVPTRELCMQVTRELVPLARARGRRVVSIFGGVSDRPQRQALSKAGTIVVACPGRLEDLVGQKALRLDGVLHVVVDEADQMSDMGFLPAVRRILDATDPARQTQLFSATLGGPVASLVKQYQRDPVRHEVGSALPTISVEDHEFVRVERTQRVAAAAQIIADGGTAIVFCRTRHGASRVARQLGQHGVDAAELHGGRSQAQRDRALQAFAQGRVRALVATDVAARGIHIDDVACVIHFDIPADVDTYIHRSGRTGRAGAGGRVIVLSDETTVKATAALRKDLARISPHSSPAGDSPTREISPAPAQHHHRDSRTKQDRGTNGARAGLQTTNGDKKNRRREDTQPTNGERTGAGRTGARRSGDQRVSARKTDGVQTRQQTARAKRHHVVGQISMLQTNRGFGFISRDSGKDLFVHHTNISRGEWQSLSVGDRVRFRIGPGPKGSQAIDVTVI